MASLPKRGSKALLLGVVPAGERRSRLPRSSSNKERSAAPLSAKRSTAPVGVLASCLESTRRDYFWWKPCCAGPLQSAGYGLRANLFDFRYGVHAVQSASHLALRKSLTRDGRTSSRALAKPSGHKLCILRGLAALPKGIRASTRDTVPRGNTFQATKASPMQRNSPHPDESLPGGGVQAAAPSLFSRLRTACPSRFR